MRVDSHHRLVFFSAVTSPFIVDVNSELKPNPNELETGALHVLIYKIDNTTFGDDLPAVPRWTGPPRTTVQVQAILFASLAASLSSAFLAMLGKQWLNRYMPVDTQGSAIECSQHRHRKLDDIVCWYFNHVIEPLPLMLQVAPGRAHPVRLCPFCAFLGYEHDHRISSPRSHLVWRSLLPLHRG